MRITPVALQRVEKQRGAKLPVWNDILIVGLLLKRANARVRIDKTTTLLARGIPSRTKLESYDFCWILRQYGRWRI